MTNPQSTCAAAAARYNKPSELAAELHKPTEFTLFNRLHFVLNNVANIDHLWRYLSTIFTFSYELFTSALNVIHRSEQFHSFCTHYVWAIQYQTSYKHFCSVGFSVRAIISHWITLNTIPNWTTDFDVNFVWIFSKFRNSYTLKFIQRRNN